ncbi:MAG: TetR/AcrR family transcriptional regulator [Bacteroidota bacterium]
MPRVKQFCEEDVLKKAMELFWEKGFHATSMQDLVSHLGINRASLYDTYGGKEELFDAAFKHYRESAVGWLEDVFQSESSIKAGFKRLFSTAIQEAVTDQCRKGCFVVNTTTELVPGNQKIDRTLVEHKAHMEDLFITYIQRGIENGEIPAHKDAQEIGLMLFTLYNGIRVVSKVDTDTKKLQKVVDSGLSVLN